ncbi:enterotoxin A family protein [Chryseobacterium fistulae]|uniref:Uncharacterized protein n=1 Tax=Chryseobacterium fistulae TaxID=2675058 RepID=A0A6N4XZI2_9FLAO|nr:enterotoxin A family protein [Chryseobacterium fistulae]CAA7393822.1 hypothetical protein CHRY9393_03561 [Chryseobacterium fistulae]
MKKTFFLVLTGIVIAGMISCSQDREEININSENSLEKYKLENIETTTTSVGSLSRKGNFLTHKFLDTDKEIPSTLFRVDSRPPHGREGEGIFSRGFTARGNSYILTDHVSGGTNLLQDGYISTTSDIRTAINIAGSQINNQLTNENQRGSYTARTYLYQILPNTSNYYSVNANLPNTPQWNRFNGQEEWVAIDRILPEHIVSVTTFERDFYNGSPLNGSHPVRTEQNSNFNQNYPPYFVPNFSSFNVGETRRTHPCPGMERNELK